MSIFSHLRCTQVASFQEMHDKDQRRITELEASLKEATERVNEYALTEQAADAAKITLYNSLSSQLFRGHPGLPPIMIAANATADQRQQAKTFSAGLDVANEKLREVLAAQNMLTSAKPGSTHKVLDEPPAKRERTTFSANNIKEHTPSMINTRFSGHFQPGVSGESF